MSRERMYADSSKAERDLGYTATSVRAAIERAVGWFKEHATVSESIRSAR
jgi:nucleoside-diphosphate-sugar epimerase